MIAQIDKIIDEFLKVTDGIAMSDIIGWILAALGGFVVYWIIDNMQTSMERHGMIKDVEASLNTLYSSPFAKADSNDKPHSPVTVRSVLHDASPWKPFVRNGNPEECTEVLIEDTQRYVKIRDLKDCEEYISTQAIHELSILFRRMEKLYKDNILRPIDLSDLWREILPMGVNGRLEFYETYFSVFDVEPIAYVVMSAVVACDAVGNKAAVSYFRDYYRTHTDLHRLFINNKRLRIWDMRCKRKFMRIMSRL